MKFIILINVQMPTVVGILTFISMLTNVKILIVVGILTFISMMNTSKSLKENQ